MRTAESQKSKQLLFQVSRQTGLCSIGEAPQREVILMMTENGPRENLWDGLRVFVQYFPSEIPLHRCCSLIAVVSV